MTDDYEVVFTPDTDEFDPDMEICSGVVNEALEDLIEQGYSLNIIAATLIALAANLCERDGITLDQFLHSISELTPLDFGESSH